MILLLFRFASPQPSYPLFLNQYLTPFYSSMGPASLISPNTSDLELPPLCIQAERGSFGTRLYPLCPRIKELNQL